MMIDANRLRFAVANFRQLQGLRQAALGLLILMVCSPLLMENAFGATLAGILLAPALIGFYFASGAIAAYYEQRIGRVEPVPTGPMRAALTIFLISFGPMLIHPGSLSSFQAYMHGFSSAWWIGCIYLGFVIRTRRRWYYLPFGALFLLLGAWRSSTADLDVWSTVDRLVLLTLPAAMIITGMLDHLYLLRSFPRTENRDA
jgi:hypothetical protein